MMVDLNEVGSRHLSITTSYTSYNGKENKDV